MAYNTKEISTRAGEPIEFVRFSLGETSYRYTTSPIEEELFSEIYEAIPFERSAPSLSPEISQNQMTFTMPRNVLLPVFFTKYAPRQSCFVVVYRKHRGEADGDAISYWQGAVEGFSFKGEEAEIVCTGLEYILKKKGLRYRYSPRCRYFFADGRCPVPPTAVTTDSLVISASSNIIQAAEFALQPNGYYKFGEIITPELESRFVVDHVGDTISLIAPFPNSPIGKIVKALAGCDYTAEMCESKFGAYTDGGRKCGCFDTVPVINVFEKGIS